MEDMLDCGHFNTFKVEERKQPNYTGGTGYATTADNRKICYACAALQTADEMKKDGKGILYYVGGAVTDWPGVIRYKTFNVNTSKGYGFYGDYPIVTGRFEGPDGYIWAFRNAGDNQIARCRRTKMKPKQHYTAPRGAKVIFVTRDARVALLRRHGCTYSVDIAGGEYGPFNYRDALAYYNRHKAAKP